MSDLDVVEHVVALAGKWQEWSVENIVRHLEHESWQASDGNTIDSRPAWWSLDGALAHITVEEGTAHLEVTVSAWSPGLDDIHDEIDRLTTLAEARVDELRTMLDSRLGKEWVAGQAVVSEWDEFGYGHHFGWRKGALSLVVGVVHEDKELPVRATVNVYET
jgi:hypothetical protein